MSDFQDYELKKDIYIQARDCDIIIRVRNEKEALQMLLEDLSQQKNIKFNIILLDTESTDGTEEFILGRDDILFFSIKKEHFHYGKSLDFLVSRCVSPYIFSFSSHIRIPDCNLLRKAIHYLESEQNDNTCAGYFRQVPNKIYGCSEYEKIFLKRGFPRLSYPEKIRTDFSTIKFSNAASVFKQSYVRQHKFGRYNGSEDKIWAFNMLKNGNDIIYFGNLEIQHSHDENINQLRKRIYINYVAQMQYTHRRIYPLKVFFKYFLGLLLLFPISTKIKSFTYAKTAYIASKEALDCVFASKEK